MVRFAGDETRAAGAAGAAFARARRLVAAASQDLEDRNARGNLEAIAGSREAHAEGLVAGPRRGAGIDEAFEVDCGRRPMARHVAHRFEERPGSAAIQVRRGRLLEDRPEIERAHGIAAVVMDDDLPAEVRALHLVAERGVPGRTREVVERVAPAFA